MVLRSSRTLGGVLQMALYCLEAICPKILQLIVKQERLGQYVDESVLDNQIYCETDMKLTHLAQLGDVISWMTQPYSQKLKSCV